MGWNDRNPYIVLQLELGKKTVFIHTKKILVLNPDHFDQVSNPKTDPFGHLLERKKTPL